MKSILILLRFPFSLFLLPVYLFCLSQTSGWSYADAWILGVLWHVVVYPASNALNSYYDRDEGPIGGLARPPAVTKNLYWVATSLDILAVGFAGFYWNLIAGLGIGLYILISRAYSSFPIRLKQYPWLSWVLVGFFQGAFVYQLTAYILTQTITSWFPALLASGTLWAIYPITQVYQHAEDAKRGDRTLSMILGIRGTFLFTGTLFGLTSLGYFFYWPSTILGFWLCCQSPIVLFFMYWTLQVFQDPNQANHTQTMRLNLCAALFLNAFYLILLFK